MHVDRIGAAQGRSRLHPLIAALAAMAALALVALALPSSAAAQTPGQMTFISASPSYGATVGVNRPGGGTTFGNPSRFDLSVNVAGTVHAPEAGFCVDLDTRMSPGNFDVIIQSPGDTPALTTPKYQAIAWLLARTPALIAAAAKPGLEAGALQMAIWILSDQADASNPIQGNAALESRTLALVAEATGKTLMPLTMSASPTSGATGSTVTISLTGTAGTTANLAVTTGSGSLGASTVTFDTSGQASTTLTSAADGSVTVEATAPLGEFRRAVKDPQAEVPSQDVVYLVPVSASTTVTFATPSPPPPPPPPPPPVAPPDTPQTPSLVPPDPLSTPASPPAPSSAPPAPGDTGAGMSPASNVCLKPDLRVRIAGPRRPKAGQRAKYTVKVSNRSNRRRAEGVTVRIAIPPGYSVARRPRGSRIRSADVVIPARNLGPRRMRSVMITLRADRTAAGSSGIRAVITARCGSARSARGITTRPLFQQVSPAVTG